jgi:nucleoside-diphosphate-sugar epimerase
VATISVWVSGSRGFIGRYLIDALERDLRYQVRCVSNNDTLDDSVTYIDFSDRTHIRKVVDVYGAPNIFVHLGWGSVSEPQSDVHLGANVVEARNLIDELYDVGLEKFVLLGSASEYGDREGALAEDMDGIGKLTNYVKGKCKTSAYGFDIAKELDKIFIHIRLFYTYGAGQQHNSLINQLYKNAVEKTTMNLSPCEHYRDYIHVSDVVEGIKQICDIEASATVNLGSGRVVQLRDFVERLWKSLGGAPEALNFGAHEKPAHEPGQPRSYADLERLQKLTGWVPALSLDQGVSETADALHRLSK